MLDTFFADTVRSGWRPVNPCTDPAELARLEQSGIRGDCISPLLREGDIVFIDPDMAAEPGDIASFRLSQRGADAQNSALPAGQAAWSPGSKWCKLLGVSHGFEMVCDRHGNTATATLMACESPDDVPVLHPVRNVMRNGRLLFGAPAPASPMIPRRGVLLGALGGLALAGCNANGIEIQEMPAVNEDSTSGAQIGANAVSQIVSVYTATTNSLIAPATTGGGSSIASSSLIAFCSYANILTTGGGLAIDFSSAAVQLLVGSGCTGWSITLGVYRYPSGGGTAVFVGSTAPNYNSTQNTLSAGTWANVSPLTFTVVDTSSPSPGSWDYVVAVEACSVTGSTTGVSMTVNGATLKVREIKK